MMSCRRYAFALVCALPLLWLGGCSKLVNVEGLVTLDDKPLQKGSITFIPEAHGGKPAVAPIMRDGRFSLGTGNKDGALRGKYKVVISSTREGKEILTPTYSSTQKTLLTFEVSKDSAKDVHFDLNSQGTILAGVNGTP